MKCRIYIIWAWKIYNKIYNFLNEILNNYKFKKYRFKKINIIIYYFKNLINREKIFIIFSFSKLWYIADIKLLFNNYNYKKLA